MLVAKTGLLPSPRAEATLANGRLQRGTFLSFPPLLLLQIPKSSSLPL